MESLIGHRFGRLTGISFMERRGGIYYWQCRCDCDSIRIVRATSLKNGVTKSCGCYHKDVVSKHGHTPIGIRSPTYRTWNAMISRCTNPKHISYANYGGRGIDVCER